MSVDASSINGSNTNVQIRVGAVFEEEMKVGPKGQVVIPQPLRKTLGIHPGSKIVFKLEGGKLVLEKSTFDAVAVFEAIARKGPSIKKIDPHAYEEELASRSR